MYSSVLIGSFLYFLFVEVLTVYLYSPEFGEHLYDHYLEHLSGRLIILFCLVLFAEILSSSLVWKIFLALFILPLCVYLYVLGRSGMSPGLGRVAMCRRCPVGPSSMVLPQVTEPGAQRVSPVWAACALFL